ERAFVPARREPREPTHLATRAGLALGGAEFRGELVELGLDRGVDACLDQALEGGSGAALLAGRARGTEGRRIDVGELELVQPELQCDRLRGAFAGPPGCPR